MPVLAARQALRRELDAVAAGTSLETLAAGDGGLSAGTFGADADLANEASRARHAPGLWCCPLELAPKPQRSLPAVQILA